jgi:hypothetical protein
MCSYTKEPPYILTCCPCGANATELLIESIKLMMANNRKRKSEKCDPK